MGLKERRTREKEERRRQIIDAARSLLFEKGLQSTSINQIAKRSELAVGTIYFYYASKEDLFAELQEEGLELLFQKIRDAETVADDPAAQLTSMAMAYFDFNREHKDYFDIINYFLSSPRMLLSAELKRRVDGKTEEILIYIESVLMRLRAGKNDGNCEKKSMGMLFLAALHGLMQFQKFEATIFKGAAFRGLYGRAVEQLINGLSLQGE